MSRECRYRCFSHDSAFLSAIAIDLTMLSLYMDADTIGFTTQSCDMGASIVLCTTISEYVCVCVGIVAFTMILTFLSADANYFTTFF